MVGAGAFSAVAYQPKRRLSCSGPGCNSKHRTSVHYWTRKPLVTAMTPFKAGEIFPATPFIDLRFRHLLPPERARRFGLIRAIDLQGVMSGGAAKAVAKSRLARGVTERARIGQPFAPVYAQ